MNTEQPRQEYVTQDNYSFDMLGDQREAFEKQLPELLTGTKSVVFQNIRRALSGIVGKRPMSPEVDGIMEKIFTTVEPIIKSKNVTSRDPFPESLRQEILQALVIGSPEPHEAEILAAPESTISPQEQGFLDAINQDPQNDTNRLVYADWLQDNHPGRYQLLMDAITGKFDTISLQDAHIVLTHFADNPHSLQTLFDGLNFPEDFNPKELLKMFRSIKLGDPSLQTAEQFQAKLQEQGIHTNQWSDSIITTEAFRDSIATEQTTQETVTLSVAQLGFPNGATREQIYQRAQELGLTLAAAEAGPQARFQDLDQKEGEYYLIGMEPITASSGSAGDPEIFRVAHDSDGFWLYADIGSADDRWGAGNHWLFFRGK